MTAHAKTVKRHTIPFCAPIDLPRGKGRTADARGRLCPLTTCFSFNSSFLCQLFPWKICNIHLPFILLFDAAAILDRHAIGCNRRLCSRRSVGLYLPDAAIAFRAPALPQEMRATTRVQSFWCKRSVGLFHVSQSHDTDQVDQVSPICQPMDLFEQPHRIIWHTYAPPFFSNVSAPSLYLKLCLHHSLIKG